MLVHTNLISDIKIIFNVLKTWNIFPLACPYSLDESPVLSEVLKYNFQVNKVYLRFYWKFHLLSLVLSSSLAAINIPLNSNRSIFDIGIYAFFSIVCALMAATVCFHHQNATRFIAFLNQLLRFEANHCKNKWAVLKKNPNLDTSCLWVSYACRFFSIGHFLHCLIFGLACVLFPHASWNILSFAYEGISLWSDNTEIKVIMVLALRLVIFMYNYISMRVFMDLATVNILLNLLISNFSIHFALRIFQR